MVNSFNRFLLIIKPINLKAFFVPVAQWIEQPPPKR
jgi:hypothetical protein